jgi:hypothetical protein
MPGNKSYIIAKNNGKSEDKNLGTLESLIALIRTILSSRSGFCLLRLPAITKTDLTALKPKS